MDKQKELDGKLIIAMSRAFRHIHRDSELLLRQNGMTMSQFAVLEALLHKGDLTIGQLIAAVLSNSGNMTVVVRNLEKQGWVVRRENSMDRRSFLIGLTDAGRNIIEKIFPEHMALVRKALSALDTAEETAVIEILKKLK